MTMDAASQEVRALEDQLAAMDELLSVQERVVGEQSAKLARYAGDLERANEEVKQFAYIVSHDLRAPLINLRGFAAELRAACTVLDLGLAAALAYLGEEQQREVEAALRQDIPQALEFLEASVTRMDRFINAVLKLSRLGRNDLHFERVSLHDTVQGVLGGLAHQIEERQVQVTVGPLPDVVADRTAMEQIVGNILSNALNYLEPGRPGEIEVTGEPRAEGTTFVVRDNGRGIAVSDMPKVFALFRRAGRQDVKGEGMGLAYAQALAHRHGGYIRCDSELGVGTTFTVLLGSHPDTKEGGNAPTAPG
jgi:signal transduction histidine kinase